MKRFAFIVLGILVVALAAGGVWFGAKQYLSSNAAAKPICSGQHLDHLVTITDNKLSTAYLEGKLCDTLTIRNNDNTLRLMAFGPHDKHQPYDGITEEVLTKGQSLHVTLNQLGTFSFHDHIHDELVTYFTVTQ